MDNNKILEAARNNKEDGCEYENVQTVRATVLGAIVAIVVSIVLFLIEYFVKGLMNISLLVVVTTAGCAQLLYDGIKTKETCSIVSGVLFGVFALLLLLIFIAQVVAK